VIRCGWLALGLCLEACTQAPALAAAVTPFPFAVEYAGCAAVLKDGSCEVDGPLRLWVAAAPGTPLRVLADDKPLEAAFTPIQSGLAATLVTGDAASVVLVSAAGARWTLALDAPQVHPQLVRARALKAAGKLDEADQVLASSGPLPPRDAARAASLRARLTLSRGALEQAVSELTAAQALHHQAGSVSDEVNDALVRAYALVQLRQLEAAREAISSVDGVIAGYPEGAAQAGYYLALSAREGGDLRRARNLLTEAEARARRLGLTRQLAAIDQVVAVVLAQLGQFVPARERFERQRSVPGAAPCDRASLRVNLAWVNELAAQAGQRTDDVEPLLSEALALYLGECPSPLEAANVRTHLALVELRRGNPDKAAAQLKAAKAGPVMQLRLALWWHDFDGRVALAKGAPAIALKHFRRLEALAQASVSSDATWRAATGQAEALSAMGDRRAALTALERAESELDREGLRTPVTGGLQGVLDSKDRSARHAVTLLLEAGRAAEAFAIARHARARALRWDRAADRLAALDGASRAQWHAVEAGYHAARAALDAAAADDWKLPADKLTRARADRAEREGELREALEQAMAALGEPPAANPAPIAEGTLMLLAFPTRDRWVAFAASSTSVEAMQFEVPAVDDTARWASALLSPFDAAIAEAKRLAVLPYGPMRAVDVHALPWRGAPVLKNKAVHYALDLGRSPPPAGPEGQGALVVGDPRGDLPFARAEASSVAAAFTAPTVLLAQAATRRALTDALVRADHFHYAGHGRATGTSGWEAELVLANGSLLAADVLALPRVPRMVVLSGCDTARTATSGVEPMGLGQAFVVAGAQAVIASTRTVDDVEASRIIAALYADGAVEPELAADRLRQAVAGELDKGNNWQAFRVLTP
jgi:tetratricopeptide (TPR) repeat protein